MTSLLADLIKHYQKTFEATVFKYPNENFDSIFTFLDFEQMMKSTRFVENDILVYKSGQVVNDADLMISKNNKSDPLLNAKRFSNKKLHRFFLTGKVGFKVNAIYDFSEKLNKFRRTLAQTLACNVSINAYYSPAGSEKVLAPHRDGYNILILQLAGQKKFYFGEITDEKVKTDKAMIELSAGEALYLPARLAHYAEASEGKDSFHLTVGLHELRLEDYVHFFLRNSPGWQFFVEKSLPINSSGNVTTDEFRQMVGQATEIMNQQLADPKFLEQFLMANLNNSEI